MHLFGDYEPGVNGSVGSGVNGPELIGIGKNTIWVIRKHLNQRAVLKGKTLLK